MLKNRTLPFGLNAIIAKIYKDSSWLDSKECIVLDYSELSVDDLLGLPVLAAEHVGALSAAADLCRGAEGA